MSLNFNLYTLWADQNRKQLERSPKKAQCIWFAMVKELVEVVDDELAGEEEERGGGLQEGGKIN